MTPKDPNESQMNIDQATTKSKAKRTNYLDQPGEFRMIAPEKLLIDEEYQRSVRTRKVEEFSIRWSWIACGVVTVGDRRNTLYVIDGQHRVLAAQRAGLKEIPCLVFVSKGAAHEAESFFKANNNRKPMSSIDKYRALLVAGDPSAVRVDAELRRLGFSTVTHAGADGFRSVGWAMATCSDDPALFVAVLGLAREICLADGTQLQENTLKALVHLSRSVDGGLNDRMRDRIRKIGAKRIAHAIKMQTLLEQQGGDACYARGALNLINTGLRNKFEFKK